MRLLLLLIHFELRQQLRSHVFWIVFAISALMVTGALWLPELRVGIGGDARSVGAETVVRTHLVWSLFYMFTAAAFAADVVLRDTLTGFEPIVRSTPAPRRLYLLGRFAGGFLATAICFLSVPSALLVLPLDPAIRWSDLPGSAFATGLLALALPNLFTSSVFFFVLATRLRSMLGTLIGAVGLLSLYGLGAAPGGGVIWAFVEPFGFAAWAEGDRTLLLANRALWLLLSLAALAIVARAPARQPKVAVHTRPVVEEPPPPAGRNLPSPRFGVVTGLVQFAHRTRFELRQLLWSPTFAILLIMGLGNAAATIWRLHSADPSADAQATVRALIDAFDLVPIVVAIFFAGELAWNERDHRIDDLIGASAVPNSAMLLPKLAALGLALLALALASAGAALTVPQLFGHAGPSLWEIAVWYVVPRSFDWLLLGTLAIFFQAVSPNKIAGWGWAVLFLIVSLALDQYGYRDSIYHYGRYPGHPFPGALSGAEGANWYRAYWAALALLLLAVADAMTSRASRDPLAARTKGAARRFRGAGGLAALSAGAVYVVLALLLS
jgi:ABC-type transport system involved in multi-copper enzyme maturation permease subunit